MLNKLENRAYRMISGLVFKK